MKLIMLLNFNQLAMLFSKSPDSNEIVYNMPDKESKGRLVRITITTRLGVRDYLDELGERIKKHTGINANRSKLLTILAKLAHEAKEEIDYGKMDDETTLQQELARAIARKLPREPEQKP